MKCRHKKSWIIASGFEMGNTDWTEWRQSSSRARRNLRPKAKELNTFMKQVTESDVTAWIESQFESAGRESNMQREYGALARQNGFFISAFTTLLNDDGSAARYVKAIQDWKKDRDDRNRKAR